MKTTLTMLAVLALTVPAAADELRCSAPGPGGLQRCSAPDGSTNPIPKGFNVGATGTTLGFAGKLLGLDILSTLNLSEADGLVTTLAEPTLERRVSTSCRSRSSSSAFLMAQATSSVRKGFWTQS